MLLSNKIVANLRGKKWQIWEPQNHGFWTSVVSFGLELVKAAAISDSLNSLNPAFYYMFVIDELISEALERGTGSTVDRV